MNVTMSALLVINEILWVAYERTSGSEAGEYLGSIVNEYGSEVDARVYEYGYE